MAFPETEGIRFLKKDPSRHRVVSFGGFFQNSLSVFGIEDAGGYQSFFPRRYGEYVHLSQYGADTPIPENLHRSIKFRGFGSPLLHLLNIRYLLFPASASLDFPQYPLVYDGEIRIYRNRNAFPRAFFVTEYRWCDSRQDAFQLLSNFQTEDFRKRVVLENGQRPDVASANPSGEENEASLIWIAYQNDSIEIDVRTQSDGYLVISDGYHPDWEVSIDGIPTRLYRANAVMRSVFVPAGRHRVRMEFSPRALMAGAGMTLLGWAALLISALCCGALEWTRRQNEKPSV
jgi:hypothetical protein